MSNMGTKTKQNSCSDLKNTDQCGYETSRVAWEVVDNLYKLSKLDKHYNKS